jgi:hypothetical protein
MIDDSQKDVDENHEAERQRRFYASNPGLDKRASYSSPENYTFREASERLTSQPQVWQDGFKDPLWNLGQLVLWVATRRQDFVDDASDASGAIGKDATRSEAYGLVRAAERIEGIEPEQVRDALAQIHQRCLDGTLTTTILPDHWMDFEIVVIDSMPMVVLRGDEFNSVGHVIPNLRFKREEVLRCFPPPGPSPEAGYIKLPKEPPPQPQPSRAWRVLKKIYSDHRVPELGRERLAEIATAQNRVDNGGDGSIISSDAIRRALGLKD